MLKVWAPAFAGVTGGNGAVQHVRMRAEIQPAVYVLASRRNGTLYIGVTGDLCSRIAQHRDGSIPGFTKKYDVKTLVWFQ